MRNREIAAHGGCNLFLRPKSKERATNTAFRWGYGVDSKHSKRVIDELFPNEPEENYMMHCPECDHKMIVKK